MEKEEIIKVLRKIEDYNVNDYFESRDIKGNKSYNFYRCPICKKECSGWEITSHLIEHEEFSYLKIIPSNPRNWVSVILNLLENNLEQKPKNKGEDKEE